MVILSGIESDIVFSICICTPTFIMCANISASASLNPFSEKYNLKRLYVTVIQRFLYVDLYLKRVH